jgi:hypothetical protein
MISVTNSTAYIYYYIFFPTTKAGTGCGLDCNSMQIAEITFYYDANNTTTSTASGGGSVVNPGSLCCGGSAAAFSANVGVSSRISNFANNANTLGDNRVIITQIGNNNTVAVTQSGVRNYADFYINGSNNSVTSNQTVAGANVLNFVEQDLVGSNNTVNYSQTGTGGSKAISTEIYSNSNNVSVQQKDSGSHHAEISLSGGNKSVTLTQQGSAGHMARIELSGGATSITATQSGSTQQHYSITHNCATSSCSAITVTQGQQ